jgi:excinuclease ABC subunit A
MDLKQGFNRVEIDGEAMRIEDLLKKEDIEADREILLLVDRMVCDKSKDSISRLSDSVETAFY